MGNLNRASFAAIRSLAHTSIGASYAKIGSVLADPAVVLMFINNTNGDCFVSTDGTADHLLLPASTYQSFDIRTNSPNLTDLMFSQGTQFWVKDGPTAPTSGSFYIEIVQFTRS